MIKELENKIAQLQYEISCLGLDKEELTGVSIRTEELKVLVKNIEVISCCKSDSELLQSKVVKLTNQWLEDGDYHNDFDVQGRYTEVWVKKEEFEKNKTHTKP